MSEWAKIAELADTNPESLPANTDQSFGFGYIDLGSVDDGTIDWPRVQYVSFKDAPSRARRVCISGDALFGTVRPNLQSHGYVPDGQRAPLVASTGFTVIRAHKNVADGRYIFFSLLSKNILRQSINAAVGSNYPAVTDRDVRQFRLFAPPIEQQSKIADVLASLDTQIQKTEALIAKLEKVKEGLLQDLLTRGIDENGHLRPSPEQAPELYKESPLGLIPREWSVSTLGQRLSQHGGLIQTGPFGSQLHAEEYVSEGIPVVMPQDMRDIDVSRENIAQITEERAKDLSRHRVAESDLLFSRRGDLSRCSFMSTSNKGWLCGTGCLLLRPADSMNGYWLASIYKQPGIQSQVYGMAVGSTMVNLNSSILANIVIPIPALHEQNLVVEAIRSSKRKILDEKKSLNKMKVKKSGLMDDLLTGRVRVTSLLEQAQEPAPA